MISFREELSHNLEEDLNDINRNNGENMDLTMSNISDMGMELNDIIDDNNNDSFGISLYEDLIDISSIDINNTSNIPKIIEDEVTLKLKIEKNLGLYKISMEDRKYKEIIRLDEISNVSIGLCNDVVGYGNLNMELVEDEIKYYTLSWQGKLLDCFVDTETVNNNFLYSFPMKYIIDINLKYIYDESLIFIKSDFELKNETIFLQLSFENKDNANYWYNIISKYKNHQNKSYFSIEDVQTDENDQYNANRDKKLDSDIKSKNSSVSNNINMPKISIPFFREFKNLRKFNNCINTRINNVDDNYSLISISDKILIEKTIKNLIFSENDKYSGDINFKKRIIEQKCNYINFLVNSLNFNVVSEHISKVNCGNFNLLSSSSCSDNNDYINKDKNDNNGNFTCPICFETFNNDEIVILSPCGHKICYYCEKKLVDSICPWDRLRYRIGS